MGSPLPFRVWVPTPWVRAALDWATPTSRPSVGLKIDLHNNAGEGPESTGLYTKGAVPMGTTGSVSLTSSGIDIHSGDPMTLHLVYNGTTLTMTLTDTVTKVSFTHAFTVNIPSIVGNSTAYVGFTGASGGIGADQEILNWKLLQLSATPTNR